MTYDPDFDTQAPRSDRPASEPPLDPGAGIGNIWTAIALLALLFAGGFIWIFMSGDTNVASSDPPAAAASATTGAAPKSSD